MSSLCDRAMVISYDDCDHLSPAEAHLSCNVTILCLSVTDGGSVDKCSRLSHAGFWMHCNIHSGA